MGKTEKTMGKTIAIIGLLFLIVILSLSYMSASRLLCLTYGQSLPSGYTCWSDQCINICVDDSNYHTNPAYCYGYGACDVFEGGGNLGGDTTPPEVSITSPNNEQLISSRSVLFDFEFNEPSSIYYLDHKYGRNRWKRICSNCGNGYSRKVSFKDGFNKITLKFIDRNENYVEFDREFTVDSRKPRISREEPRRGFADGNFKIQIQEENPKELIINYGNIAKGRQDHVVDIANNCTLNRGRYTCDTYIDLKDYDGTNIFYTTKLTDVVGSVVESRRPIELTVDMTFPKINNQDDLWSQGEGRYSRYITFSVDVTEQNFEKVYYTYKDSRGNYRDRTLCTRLKDGVCEKKVSFREGNYDLMLKVIDEAGNEIGTPLSFEMKY